MDHNFSNSDTFFFRYTIDDTHQTKPLQFPDFHDRYFSRSQYVTLSENHIFSPALLNAFRASFSRTGFVTRSVSSAHDSFVTGQSTGSMNIGAVISGPETPVRNRPAATRSRTYSPGATIFSGPKEDTP